MKLNFSNLLLLSVIPFGVACSKVSSEDVAPTAMYFTMTLQKDNGSTVECYTRISVTDEAGNSVELDEDDSLSCNGYPMKREKSLIGDYIFYTAQLPSIAGGSYQITYVRDGRTYGSGYHQLPPRLNLQMPNNGFVIQQNQPLNATWTPFAGGTISASLSASFVNEKGESKTVTSYGVADPSSGLMALQALNLKGIPLPQQSMNATMIISRKRHGSLDGYMKGHFDAIDSITRSGTVVP